MNNNASLCEKKIAIASMCDDIIIIHNDNDKHWRPSHWRNVSEKKFKAY